MSCFLMLCVITVIIDDNLSYCKQDEILVNIHDMPVTVLVYYIMVFNS